jgi:hypothetical protein
MFRFILTIASMGVAAALALAWTLLMPAHAHDYKRPDLDGWHSSLHRKGLTFGYCSKEDCHTTEAEVRDGYGGDWAAGYRAGWCQPRLGIARLGPHAG